MTLNKTDLYYRGYITHSDNRTICKESPLKSTL